MGLVTSEIAVNTIPCCCDLPDGYEQTDIDEEQKQNLNPSDYDSDSDGGDFSGMDDIDDDDFMEDPQNRETESVITKMSWDVLDAAEDLWTVLDEIFFSYQPQELVDTVQDDKQGLKKGLQIILDDYTQNALFAGIKNYSTHKRKHKFNITKTMSIPEYVKNNYKTESLWFYDDKSYGLVTQTMEGDEVCEYECVEGSKYVSESQKMECDNNYRHRTYPATNDRCLLHLQYVSFGSISTPFYKTRDNYAREANRWCFSDNYNAGDEMDIECTVIAFSSYGQHYTSIYSYDKPKNDHDAANANGYGNDFMRKKIEFLDAVKYINDVSYLKKYAVRDGYNKYGALAYFNANQQVIAIQTYWDNRIWMKPTNLNDKKYLQQWKYTKWIWKISVIISSYLTEWIARCRFREINSFIQAVHKNLNMNHCIRRLFKPFLYGTISANQHMKTLCEEYGLYHRIFGFKYASFCELLNDAMKSYRFKILKKKFKKLKALDASKCPGFNDFNAFWAIIHDFVSKYFEIYYGENIAGDILLTKDPKLASFYSDIVRLLGVESKYRYKRFNVVMLVTHFICTVTIYNKHLNEALSYDGMFLAKLFYPTHGYSLQSYGGCAIRKNNDNKNDFSENDILSYTEYLLLVVNNGIKEKNFNLKHIWSLIILRDDCKKECINLFSQTHKNLINLEKQIQNKNKTRRIPYNACCVSYLQSSACL